MDAFLMLWVDPFPPLPCVLTVARTALQVRMSSGQAGTTSALKCLQDTVRNEGMLAVYKGVVPPLLLTGSINSILFGTQAIFIRAQLQPGQTTGTVQQTMIAAVGSGFVMSFLVAPMEGVKARLQVSTLHWHPPLVSTLHW